MVEERVLYTDGHDVTVTDSVLHVRNHDYKISGVIKSGIMILRPVRAPGIILLILGTLLIIAGVMNAVSPEYVPAIRIGEQYVNANTVALWTGGALAFIGLLAIGLARERYSVRIATAEGERDVLVSRKREYVAQIVDALHQAANYIGGNRDTDYFTVRTT